MNDAQIASMLRSSRVAIVRGYVDEQGRQRDGGTYTILFNPVCYELSQEEWQQVNDYLFRQLGPTTSFYSANIAFTGSPPNADGSYMRAHGIFVDGATLQRMRPFFGTRTIPVHDFPPDERMTQIGRDLQQRPGCDLISENEQGHGLAGHIRGDGGRQLS